MLSTDVIVSQADRRGKDFGQDERRSQAGFAAQQPPYSLDLDAGTDRGPLCGTELLAGARRWSGEFRGRGFDFRQHRLDFDRRFA